LVTAIVNDPGAKAGQPLEGPYSITSKLKGSGVISRGDLCVVDTGTAPDGVKISPTGRNAGPFYVAMETVVSATTQISVAQGGVQCLTADATIEVGKPVMSATSTAGQVITWIPATITVTTPTGAEIVAVGAEFADVVGVCEGFIDNWGTPASTAPVDGDLCAIRMKAGI
jgi:hypothetical protein